jgi:membrane-bound acyltransferase YfiQ involved in biofilm formation
VDHGRHETEEERLDRNLLELLNELRVALPGVQVLFAFLLVVPFQVRFERLTAFQRDVYFATLCCALVASALLIAPSAYHRLNFRSGQKRAVVMTSNKLAIAGIFVLALAMTGVMTLITDVVFDTTATIIVTSSSAAVFALLWLALPLRHRAGD